VSGSDLVVIVLASGLGALIKGVTGMGYPIVAVPLISLAMGVEDAVVVVALPNLAANVYLCWEAREASRESRDLDRLLVFGVVGAVVGTILLVNVPEPPLQVALAITVVVFVVLSLRHAELRISPATSHRWSPAAGLLAGLSQGAVGASGPVVATWLHGYRLSPKAYVFSVTSIFAVTGFAQIVVLVSQGAFTAVRLLGALLAALPVAAMIPLGVRLRGRLGGPAFERAVLAALLLSATSLLLDLLT